MDSLTGGRWIFSSSLGPIVLGINNGVAPVFPTPQSGAFNIEVFTNTSVSGLAGAPNPDAGFNSSVADASGTIDNGFLTGPNLVLGPGDFLVVDSVTGSTTQGPTKRVDCLADELLAVAYDPEIDPADKCVTTENLRWILSRVAQRVSAIAYSSPAIQMRRSTIYTITRCNRRSRACHRAS
jgi:hypothetical protein